MIFDENFKQFFDKDDLKLAYKKDGSILTNKFILGKAFYTLKKNKLNESITLQNIIDILYNFDSRKEWDKTIKDIKIIEIEENYTIFNMIINSPGFFISERDILDKKIEFFQSGIYYNFNSSISENSTEIDEEIIRCTTFLNVYIISEDEDNFFFLNISQLDIKMPLPDSLINIILAPKLKSFYEELIKELNKRFQ